ncbi:regulator of G protein signaling domain-containing protein [Jimgerdemannia flammicorona]|uniref:Regulator of G protein signaling domain-containing protein n=1 Tax=Jimgerdemannia flammicorona TaxID=994334 RepID=A0A433DHL3_9FUNG|nr:regulator of G protein signaling domain-containing protein [Jimgerdemannia flammicorona]
MTTKPQSSSAMLKVTETGRPFAKDIHDLFATLMISIPFDTHRHLFRNYPNTFNTEDCITNLGSLRFTQSSKGPDPKDPTRIVTTTVTTTFSMTREMARNLCQQFMDARLFENATDPLNRYFREKSIGQLTAKGTRVLVRFISVNKTHTRAPQLKQILSQTPSVRILHVERSPDGDKVVLKEIQMQTVFCVLMGAQPNDITQSNQRSNSSIKGGKDSTLSTDSANELSHVVKQPAIEVKDRQQYYKLYTQTFYGCQVCDYLCDYTTVVCREEAENIATEFLNRGWMEVIMDKSEKLRDDGLFKNSRSVLYQLTLEGRRVAGWDAEDFTESMMEDRDLYSDTVGADGRSSVEKSDFRTGEGLVSKAKERPVNLFNGNRLDDIEDDKVGWKDMLMVEPPSAGVSGETAAQAIKRSLSPKLATAKLIATRTPSKFTPNSLGRSDSITGSNEALLLSEESSEDASQTSLSSLRSLNRLRNLDLSQSSPQPAPTNSTAIPAATIIPMQVMFDPKQSNDTKLRYILDDPQLRSLFKDHLRANLCDENLDFWIDHQSLRRRYKSLSPALSTRSQKDLLAEAFHIFNTYLAPSAPLELNINHSLRLEMTMHMRNVEPLVAEPPPAGKHDRNSPPAQIIPPGTPTPGAALAAIIKLFDRTSEHICGLMASDSVPKFVKTDKYRELVVPLEKKRDSGNGGDVVAV